MLPIVGIILLSPLNPLAPLFRLFSLLTVISLVWHRRWFPLAMMAAPVLVVPLLFALLRFLGSLAMRGLRKHTYAI